MNVITAQLDYISGYLRYAHYELNLNDEELVKFKNLTKEEQKEWICEDGELIVDDYKIDDCGEITDIKIFEGI